MAVRWQNGIGLDIYIYQKKELLKEPYIHL